MRVFEANENIKNALNAFYVGDGYHSDWSSIVRTFFTIANDKINGSVKVERPNFVQFIVVCIYLFIFSVVTWIQNL